MCDCVLIIVDLISMDLIMQQHFCRAVYGIGYSPSSFYHILLLTMNYFTTITMSGYCRTLLIVSIY